MENQKPGLIPTGATKFYTMIGTPIIQVRSPLNYNRYFAEHGIDAVMIAMDVPSNQVKAHFEHMRAIPNFRGCIVTIPHKQAATDCMDEMSQRAEDLAAVNVVRAENGRLIGDMVDGLGFMLAARAKGLDMRGKRAAIIGGGVTGAAIALAMAEAGTVEIVIKEIRAQRHVFLKHLMRNKCSHIKISFELTSLEGFDIAVNATSVGMNDDPNVPFPTDTLTSRTLVADVITNPKLTPWLADGLKKGCKIQYGVEMADGQFGLMGRHMGLEISDPDGF
jgi:shikimate dehydrogenase